MSFITYILFIIFLITVSLLAYIYVGYPLLIIGLAIFFQKPVHKSNITPAVTIIIPTHNEEAVITNKLDNLLELNYPRDLLQILVCDDASEDHTCEIVRTYLDRGILLNEGSVRAGKVGALNRGMQAAEGEVFVVADADILSDPESLQELVANFADETVGCVMAQTHMMQADGGSGDSGGLYWRYEARIRQSESDLHSTVAATGHMIALRLKILQPIPPDIILDDFYLAVMTMRLGYRVISEPKAIVWEQPTSSMRDEVNRRSRLTSGRFQALALAREYLLQLPVLLQFEVISHKFLRLAIPHLMILAIFSNVLLTLILVQLPLALPRVGKLFVDTTLIEQGIFYLLAIVGKFITESGGKKSRLVKLLTLPYYLCATNFAGFDGLAKFISGKSTVLWHQARRK